MTDTVQGSDKMYLNHHVEGTPEFGVQSLKEKSIELESSGLLSDIDDE